MASSRSIFGRHLYPLIVPNYLHVYVTWFDRALPACGSRERPSSRNQRLSASHGDESVRIWGHYAVIHEGDFKFYRNQITKFDNSRTVEGDQRWKAYTLGQNVYDMWLPNSQAFQIILPCHWHVTRWLNFESPIIPNLDFLIRSWLYHAQGIFGICIFDKGSRPPKVPLWAAINRSDHEDILNKWNPCEGWYFASPESQHKPTS